MIFDRLFGRRIEAEVSKRIAAVKNTALAVRVLDDTRDRSFLRSGDTYPRDRHGYDRDEVLSDALEAWRVNPLARRIVGMITEFVVGGGVTLESKHKGTNKFLRQWWDHPLNRMDTRLVEWCDELTRSGELFIVLSTDLAGMSYVRAIPAADIQEIEAADNDVEQELVIIEKAGGTAIVGRRWPVYSEIQDDPTQACMLHYAVNRPAGAKFGESDLAPLLRWLTRYASWLEDRARLNRFRNTFVFWVKAKFLNQAEKLERQAELNRTPPSPGSILVTDESEEWSVLSPNLASFEAAEDGLALKKMVAAGSAIPLHFIAEPESATRTTAEAAGSPTFRHLQQRQDFFLWLVSDLARAVVRRRRFFDRRVNADADLTVTGTDISARDNTALSSAASTAIAAFSQLRDRGLIDDAELLRIAYRFSGESVDLEDMLRRGRASAPVPAPASRDASHPSGPGEASPVGVSPSEEGTLACKHA